MTENHELMNDEELKRLLLYEAMLLCPPGRQEIPEDEKLRVLYTMLKSINELLSLLYRCNLEMHYMEIHEVFGFYLVEKEGEKRKKHRMSARLNAYGQFLYRLSRSKELIAASLLHNAHQLDALEQVVGVFFPKVPGESLDEMPENKIRFPWKRKPENKAGVHSLPRRR